MIEVEQSVGEQPDQDRLRDIEKRDGVDTQRRDTLSSHCHLGDPVDEFLPPVVGEFPVDEVEHLRNSDDPCALGQKPEPEVVVLNPEGPCVISADFPHGVSAHQY